MRNRDREEDRERVCVCVASTINIFKKKIQHAKYKENERWSQQVKRNKRNHNK